MRSFATRMEREVMSDEPRETVDAPADAVPGTSPVQGSRTGGTVTLAPKAETPVGAAAKVPEIGGRGGPDPTRYGDWEKDGRCIDF